MPWQPSGLVIQDLAATTSSGSHSIFEIAAAHDLPQQTSNPSVSLHHSPCRWSKACRVARPWPGKRVLACVRRDDAGFTSQSHYRAPRHRQLFPRTPALSEGARGKVGSSTQIGELESLTKPSPHSTRGKILFGAGSTRSCLRRCPLGADSSEQNRCGLVDGILIDKPLLKGPLKSDLS